MIQYNLLLFCSGKIASKCLKYLNDEKINVKGIVSDKSFFQEHGKIFPGLHHFDNTIKQEKNLVKFVKSEDINLIISIQHPWILSKNLISLVNGFAFNLHNAIIPDYKGHNTISHAILNGEKVYGTTIHWLAEKVDMGDIAFVVRTKIKECDTAFSLHTRMVELSVCNFKKFINQLIEGLEVPRIPIKETGKFYSKFGLNLLKKIDDPSDLIELDRKSRAFYYPPHEPAFIEKNGKKYYVTPNQ
jgi:methionyl-tRNA formyltransferase